MLAIMSTDVRKEDTQHVFFGFLQVTEESGKQT